MKKKVYENIFAKMAQYHNEEIVPIVRNLNFSTVKIRNRRILTLRDTLEMSEDVKLSIDLLTEYITTNIFIISLLDKDQVDTCNSLIKTKVKENVIISANMIYTLVEGKKQEIKDKL